MSSRIAWIDYLKGIGIVLVVFGHTALPEQLLNAIYAFHVPLFFFASGLTFLDAKKISFQDFFIRKAKSLLVPYFFFCFLTFVLWSMRHGIYWTPEYFLNVLFGVLYSVGNKVSLPFNVPLWFLTCLFVVETLFFILQKKFSFKGNVIAVLIFSLFGFLLSYMYSIEVLQRLPWSIDVACIAVGFLGMGFYSKNFFMKVKPFVSLWCFLLCALLLCTLSLFHGRIDMASNLYRESVAWPFIFDVVLFYAAAICGILTIVFLSKVLPKNIILDFLGKNTLAVLGLHLFIGSCIKGIVLYLLHIDIIIFENAVISNILFCIASLLCVSFVAKFLKKFLPWSVGAYKR